MKKNIYKLIFGMAIIVFIVACKEEYLASNNTNFSDALAVASGTTKIQRGDFTSFADLSKGVTKRHWGVPESASILNLDNKDTSELDIIHVQFNEPGEYLVTLKCEFETDTIKLDTAFSVTVLDYIQTDIEVISIEADFYELSSSHITISEGAVVTYRDASLGNPDRRIWTFKGGDPSSAGGIGVVEDLEMDTIAVLYPSIGVYDVQLISWREAPKGKRDTLLLKDYIKVIEN